MRPFSTPMRPVPRRRASRLLRAMVAGAVTFGAVLSGVLVYGSSQAAFRGATTGPASAWTAGTLAISDDDAGTALFTVTGIKPGDTGQKCITVSYGGDLTVPVKLYASASSGTLRSYLTLTVEQGVGGSYADCSAITGTSTLWGPNTLSTFASTYTSWSNGLTTWTPTTAASRTFRFTWSLDDNDLAASTSGAVTFGWEVRSG
jgi:hypothetical protein